MTHLQRTICLVGFFFVAVYQAQATSFVELNQSIEAFKQSGQARFAPATMKKVTAYLGASMLANEQQSSAFSNQDAESKKSQALEDAISKTLEVLASAKSTAKTFSSAYAPLLALEIEANKAYVYHHEPRMMPEPEVSKHFDQANQYLNIAITASEKGLLNQAQAAAAKATESFGNCIDYAMPSLVEQTDVALSKASDLSAKLYAPHLWRLAEEAYDNLIEYRDDIALAKEQRQGVQRPTKVGYAYEMAIYAQKMTIQVKDWRRDNGSHEKLALAARHQHLSIAQALALPLDYEKVGVDIDFQELLEHVKSLQHSLMQERQQHKTELATLQTTFDKTLQATLEEQRNNDQQAFQTKMETIKSAFNSKLEKETFETKRQQKVRALFQDNEASIIANLDGSLMIRASKVQFAPSSSKVDGQYFEFLGRIKEAIAMYPDRNITLEGHTDSQGDEMANRKLSLSRAEAVKEFLIAAGIDAGRLKALGYGEVKPIASNMYEKGRAMNRRIDIIIGAPNHG